MICISLSPPYGTLIALGFKRIETRDWQTGHRGSLGIHQTAAPGPKGTTEDDLHRIVRNRPFCDVLFASLGCTDSLQVCERLPRGKIVAVVNLADCLPTAGARGPNGWGPKYADWVHELSDMERAFGDYTPGRYGWRLDGLRAIASPVPARGMPGLWHYEGTL